MAYQALLLRQNTRIIQKTIRCCSKEIEYLTWMSPDGLIVLMGKPLQLKHFILLYSFECIQHFSSIYLLLGLVGVLFHCLFFFHKEKNKSLLCTFNRTNTTSATHSLHISFPSYITEKHRRSEMAATEVHFYMIRYIQIFEERLSVSDKITQSSLYKKCGF